MANNNNDVEFEIIVLSFMINYSPCTDQGLNLLDQEDFSNETYRKIFKAISELNKENKYIDFALIDNKLKNQNINLSNMERLLNFYSSSTVDRLNFEEYCDIIKDKSNVNKILLASQKLQKDCENSEKIKENILSYSKFIQQIPITSNKNILTAKEVLNEIYDGKGLKKFMDDKIEFFKNSSTYKPEISWGYKSLDAMLLEVQKKTLVIIGARPSIGKTTFALNICRKILLQDIPVLFLTLEVSAEDLLKKYLCMCAKVNSHRLKIGNLLKEEYDNLLLIQEKINQEKLFILDKDMYLSDIYSAVYKAKEEHDIKVVFIDYLGLIKYKKNYENRNMAVSEATRELKSLAKNLDVCVICLSQLSRSSEKEDRAPMKSDLRDSGQIEADADVIMLLHKNINTLDNEKLEVHLVKNRNGPTSFFNLKFQYNIGAISE